MKLLLVSFLRYYWLYLIYFCVLAFVKIFVVYYVDNSITLDELTYSSNIKIPFELIIFEEYFRLYIQHFYVRDNYLKVIWILNSVFIALIYYIAINDIIFSCRIFLLSICSYIYLEAEYTNINTLLWCRLILNLF